MSRKSEGALANILETDRLILRPWTLEDEVGFHRVWGDPKVIWWGGAHSTLAASRKSLGEVISRCASMPQGQGWWAIIERGSGDVVGNVFLQPFPVEADSVELGYHIVHDRWGAGIATEAGRAILNYASMALGLESVVAAVHVDNIGSRRVAENLGFVDTEEILHGGLPHRLYRFERQDIKDHWEPIERDWP